MSNNVASKSLTNQWTLRIAYALRHGALRFNELERRVNAQNPPALVTYLKRMLRDGLVERHVLRVEPPANVQYKLTQLGQDLAQSASALIEWVDGNLPQIEVAREKHRVMRARPKPVPPINTGISKPV